MALAKGRIFRLGPLADGSTLLLEGPDPGGDGSVALTVPVLRTGDRIVLDRGGERIVVEAVENRKKFSFDCPGVDVEIVRVGEEGDARCSS